MWLAPASKGVDQGEDLAAQPGAAHPATDAHDRVDQGLQAETHHQRAHQQEPGVGHQIGSSKFTTHADARLAPTPYKSVDRGSDHDERLRRVLF
jgi:hypothetical protein